MIENLTMTAALFNGLGIFAGIVAGALIQYFLNWISSRKHARNALRVMQIEIAYNMSEVQEFRKRIAWLKQRISADQIDENDLFLPMFRFDYSSIGPLTSSGYFHILLGEKNVRAYLDFYYFFRADNGDQLSSMLRTEHDRGNSMAMLEWVERRAEEVLSGLRPIQDAKLSTFGLSLTRANPKRQMRVA